MTDVAISTRGGRKKGDMRPRNRPKNPNGLRIAVNVTLDPDLHKFVQWHANARGNKFSESVNQLLAEALKDKSIDVEAEEVH